MPGDVLKGHEALCMVNYKPVTILTHLPPQDTKRLLDSLAETSVPGLWGSVWCT